MDNYAYQSDEIGRSGKENPPFTISAYPNVNNSQNPNESYLVEVNARSKLFKRPKFYKNLTFILLFVLLILLILLIIIMYLYCKNNSAVKLCTSEECLRSAANLRLSLDLSLDPCDDFYKYTCGRWSKEHPNHGWFSSFSTFETIIERILLETKYFLQADEKAEEPTPVKQARDLYKSCMDTESIDDLGLEPLFKYLKQAELPLVPSLFTKSQEELATFNFDFLRSDAVIKKMFGMDVLIGFYVQMNFYNTSENVIYIGSPSQKCPLPSPLKNKDNEKHKDNYQVETESYEELKKQANGNVMRFVMSSIVRNVTGKEANIDLVEEAVDVLLNMTSFIDELVENHTDYNGDPHPETIKLYQNKTNQMLLNNINRDYPRVIEIYLQYLFENSSVTVDFDRDLLYIGDIEYDYVPKILAYVLTTSDVYLELFMWWKTVLAMVVNTSSDISEYVKKEADSLLVENESGLSYSLQCANLVIDFMGMAVSYGIADRSFGNTTKPKVEEMLINIKDAFMEQVKGLGWMDEPTKMATLEKSQEMLSFIGFPDWLFKNGSLDKYYEGVIVKNDTFLDNMMELLQDYLSDKFESLRKVRERNWTAEPTTVNAFNSFPDNTINIPLAILYFPMYHLGLEVLNYGAMGSVLGHELTHGFDNNGRKHDKFGNYKQWWSNNTIETFEEKTQCFIRQYENFTIEGVKKHVQGNKSLGEVLADNGGINHAYRAYKTMERRNGFEAKLPGFENFTHDQLFFIAFGSIWCETVSTEDLEFLIDNDEHPPHSIRVLGAVQNSPYFAKAFKCPVGTKMNPKNKCKVW